MSYLYPNGIKSSQAKDIRHGWDEKPFICFAERISQFETYTNVRDLRRPNTAVSRAIEYSTAHLFTRLNKLRTLKFMNNAHFLAELV